MKILKFGGSSVSSAATIQNIVHILNQIQEPYLVVVSALSGVTNMLEDIASSSLNEVVVDRITVLRDIHFELIRNLIPAAHQTTVLVEVQHVCNELEIITSSVKTLGELSPRTHAKIASYGEQLSSFILHHILMHLGVSLDLLDSRSLILAEGPHHNAIAQLDASSDLIKKRFKNNSIAPGFIASNSSKETVLLGRGGSDYSAAIYAYALDASSLEIWSDVNGIYNANPSVVSAATPIDALSYDEAFELAYFGAKVLYPASIIPARYKKIPIYLKNTFEPDAVGTIIQEATNEQRVDKILGVSSIKDISIITVSGVGLAGTKGSARRVFQLLEEAEVNVMLITQSCSEQSIGIGLLTSVANQAITALDNGFARDISNGLMLPSSAKHGLCILALIGDQMRNTKGLCGAVFSALGDNNINVTAIAQGASERNISIVIAQNDENKALHVIHERFFSTAVKNVHVFIAGVGNVGKEFLNILYKEKERIKDRLRINLKVMGVSNSTRMLFNNGEELTLDQALAIAINGTEYNDPTDFVNGIKELNLRNPVYVDNTASATVSNVYEYVLNNAISLIGCNKIAYSSSQKAFENLNKAAYTHNCELRYETAVGAALPIIKSIDDLMISGDSVNRIEAVISGSLNFIFNNYNGTNTFASVVLQAKNEGYTEPNPLLDLSGMDVMRKILILSRKCGYKAEMDDIVSNSFLPDECLNAPDVPALFEALEKHESHFKALFDNAFAKACKLKVVATMVNGKQAVGLQEVPATSPFYTLEGKDNVVAIYTDRYVQEPLVIKGAGAGAIVTASGVFADLMMVANS